MSARIVTSETITSDLSGRYKSTAGSQAGVDPDQIGSALQKINRDGFIIIENLFSPDEMDALKADVEPRFKHEAGRNNFEGLATQRLYTMMAETEIANPMVEHPLILGLLDKIFEPNYLLSQLQVINIHPNEAAQPLHYDDGFYPWPRPRRALGAATIIAVDDFTEDNGATVLIPKSHLWGDRMPTADDKATSIKAVMPKGSVLFFLGTLWHGGGANEGNSLRMCLTAQYCAPFCRTQENFSLSVPKARVKTFSANIQRLLGYSIHPPFMGMVEGKHPRRVLKDL
jgi:ectoine hydroxylase-related dioxygenase (phytanoyl-CoA dioxygenase family)